MLVPSAECLQQCALLSGLSYALLRALLSGLSSALLSYLSSALLSVPFPKAKLLLGEGKVQQQVAGGVGTALLSAKACFKQVKKEKCGKISNEVVKKEQCLTSKEGAVREDGDVCLAASSLVTSLVRSILSAV